MSISLQGGLDYVRNTNIGSTQNLVFEITFGKFPTYILTHRRRMPYRLRIIKTVYRFEIQLGKQSGFKVVKDVLTLNVDAIQRIAHSPSPFIGKITIESIRGKTTVKLNLPPKPEITSDDIIPKFYQKSKPKSLLLEDYYITHYFTDTLRDLPSEIGVFDFDPKIAKQPISIKGIPKLESDGSNLAIALKHVLGSKESKKKFSNLLADILPFVDSITTEKLMGSFIRFLLKEKYSSQKLLPSVLVSDGTVNIAALIFVLYFQSNKLTIVEEPERNIHPSLIAGIVDKMKKASQKRQLIVTTHNPEMVRYSKIENVLAVRRNKEGYTEVVRPEKQKIIQDFLKNDMDISEMYVQNLLEDF